MIRNVYKDGQGDYSFTDAELSAWVTWFMNDQEGMEQEVKDSLEQCLAGFFASAKAFAMHTAKLAKQAGIRCPKCHGRGHSNLYLAGAGKPLSCNNCAGTGTIEPDMMSVKASDVDPMGD